MIRLAIIGDIGSGKSHVAKKFGYPVFNADNEVSKLYKKSRKCYLKLKKILPNYITSFPIKKSELSRALVTNSINIKKITKIVHPEVQKKMKQFIKINKNKKFIVLDIPLFIENKLNKKNDILIYVQSRKSDILKKLKKRKNFNKKLMNKFAKIQLPLDYKKKKSQFVIKNDFKGRTVLKYIKNILKEIN